MNTVNMLSKLFAAFTVLVVALLLLATVAYAQARTSAGAPTTTPLRSILPANDSLASDLNTSKVTGGVVPVASVVEDAAATIENKANTPAGNVTVVTSEQVKSDVAESSVEESASQAAGSGISEASSGSGVTPVLPKVEEATIVAPTEKVELAEKTVPAQTIAAGENEEVAESATNEESFVEKLFSIFAKDKQSSAEAEQEEITVAEKESWTFIGWVLSLFR